MPFIQVKVFEDELNQEQSKAPNAPSQPNQLVQNS